MTPYFQQYWCVFIILVSEILFKKRKIPFEVNCSECYIKAALVGLT